MRRKGWKITYKFIFLIMLAVIFVSRVQILTENYDWPLDPVMLQIVYLLAAMVMSLTIRKGKIRIRLGAYAYVLAAMLAHTLLWGLVFVNRDMEELIFSHFRSQIMFVIIVYVTVFTVHQLNAEEAFLRCCYYTLSFVLSMYLLANISELDLSNIANIMSVSDRTRANFGFGHYNTLGCTCVCNILMCHTVGKNNRSLALRALDGIIYLISVCMLLCSASRSAITSLILYYLVYYSERLDELPVSKRIIFFLKLLLGVFVVLLAVWVLLEVDFAALMVLAQRSHLYEMVLPNFFETGELWLGLGYASNVAYAEGLTPYPTRWMDNAYVYFLVTTGFAGLGLMLSALVTMGVEVVKRIKNRFGREMLSVFVVYVYISLFETILFNSGGLVNYIYIPWLLLHISGTKQPEKQSLGENPPARSLDG